MDFGFSEEQQVLYDSTKRFAQKNLNSNLIENDHEGRFNREGWKACADFGIQGAPIPEEYGGRELDILSTAIMMEGFGFGCEDTGLGLAISAHTVICEIPILQFGSDEQKKTYLPKLVTGEWIGAYGLTEPEAGSDAFALKTKAIKEGDEYVINGSKIFITNGPIADVVLVFATVDPSLGPRGITTFLVETNRKGFGVSRELDKMGLRTSPTGELVFEDVRIPASNRLGDEGQGAGIMKGCLVWERTLILATSVGMMDRELQRCINYARERKQFGKSIGEFQLIQEHLTNMKARLEHARLLLYKVAWMKSEGQDATLDANLAKYVISEARKANALAAIQIHGGYGYMKEYHVERVLRDTLASTIGAGSSEIMKINIGRELIRQS